MKAIYTIQNFAKRFAMIMAAGLMAVNVWGDTSGTIVFGNLGTKISSASVSGNDDQGNTWTITTTGTTSFTQSTYYSQVGKGTEPATSITFTMTLGSTQKITAFSAEFGGFSGTAGDVSLKVGSTEIGSGSLSATTDVEVSNTSEATGTVLTIEVTNIAKGVKCYSISYTYTTACSYSMTISKGTATNCTFDLGTSGAGIASCSGVSTTVTVNPNTGYGNPSVTQSGASAAPSITGSGNNWTVSYGNNTTGTSTINVSCSANQYTVTLNDNGGSGGSGSKTVTYNASTNLTTSVTVPTKSHHDFAGYWTSTDGGSTFGTKLVNADGSWVASASDATYTYTDASKNWKYAGDITLYAKWTEHSLTNYRTTCTACEAPNHVDISGAWDRFGGETISLTATAYSTAGTGSPIDDGDITGWQWQKYNGSGWDNVTNGTSAGATTSGATTKNLQITNCGGGNSGTYRCQVSTGATCTTASAGLGVKVYVLECYTGGTTTYNFIRDGENQRGSVTVPFSCNTDKEFKIHADNDYYGNNGTVSTNVTNWEWLTDKGNCTVKAGYGGDVTFTMDYSTGGNNSTLGIPEVSVTYGVNKTIYVAAGEYTSDNAKIAIYYWSAGGNGWTGFLSSTDCSNGKLVASLPAWTQQFSIVRFDPAKSSTGNWDYKWNQTNDINISCSYDQYSFSSWCSGDGCKETFTAGTYSPTTYQITFAGNGSDGGSMSTVSSIPCGEDRTLAENGFTKTGWTFSHWTANVDVKVDDATVDAGDPIDDEATIQDITSDIALTAQWTANKYDVTLKPNSGSGSDQVVQATYGSSMPLTVKTAGTAIVVPTRTGYNFNGYWDDASNGTQYYTYTGSPKALGSARNWDKTAATNLFAHWTAKTCTVSFDNNGGTGGTNTVTATYGSALPSKASNLPEKTGYTFDGYYDSETNNDGTGTKYYNADGSSARNWDKDTESATTLYAKWNVNNYTLTWDWNGGSTSSTTHTAAGQVAYGTTLVYPANNTMSKTGYSFTGWSPTPSTMPAENTTITAQWSVNSYNVAVQTVSYVTIKATPAGGSDITEGNNANVDYNKTITLHYSSKDSRYEWGGWRVTKADDPSVSVSVNVVTTTTATFTMPAYAVTVTAYVYGDLKAWCDPTVEVTGDVHLTSTKDVPVRYSPSGADNLVTISSSDMGSATKLEVGYLNADAADAEVDKNDSPFRFYKADGSGTVDELDLDKTWGTSYPIRYTPSAFGVTNNYKLQLKFKKGDKVLKTVNHAIHGRGLPEEFVIAVKKGDIWVALPSNLASTSSQPAIVPQPITVDNTTTPTEAVYTPTTTVYKATGRENDAHISTIRFTTTGSNYLQVSGSDGTYNMWLSTSTTANVQDWQLKSSDFNAYELTIPSNNATKKMGIYNNTYMGYHGSPNYANIYILPIRNTYTDIPATVHEWGEHGAILEADMTNVASATMHVADGSAATATLTPVNAASLTEGKYVRIYKSDMTVGAVANENKQLYVHWKNAGGDEIGVSQVTIPCVVAADNDMHSIAGTKTAWAAKSEVHILPGVTLDANAGSFDGEGALSVSNLFVYPGATLKVSTGTFNATTLRLRNGWTRAGDKQYNSARVYIASSAALTKTTASMDYDIYEQSDGKHYYPLAVPFATAVKDIDYADTYLAGYSTYSTTGSNGQYAIKTYDGANRANNGEDSNNNWDLVPATKDAKDVYLQPGIGYIMTAVAVKGSAIIRVPLVFDNGWTSDGEKATYDEVTKNVVAVTAYDGAKVSENKRHKGWNMLGVPFMSCYGNVDDIYSGGGAATLINGEIVIGSGADPYSYGGEEIPYVSVPSHDFAEYIQTDITETKLLPGWSFFVQVNTSGNLTFAVSDREPDKDNPIYAPQHRKAEEVARTGIILSHGETSDKTTILVSDKYSSEYEVGADLEKMFGSGYTLATYSLSNGTRLAYNAMSKTDAQQLIPIGYRAPEDGEYTFSLNPRYAENSAFEHVYLIDYQTGEITDLMASSYTFSTERTQDDTRFTINVVPRKITTTDIEGGAASESRTQKILLNDKLYIIRGGQMYDATGKRVSEINK